MKKETIDYKAGVVIFDRKSLLYGKEEDYGKGADALFCGMPIAKGICIS